jgi:hypothetical protein
MIAKRPPFTVNTMSKKAMRPLERLARSAQSRIYQQLSDERAEATTRAAATAATRARSKTLKIDLLLHESLRERRAGDYEASLATAKQALEQAESATPVAVTLPEATLIGHGGGCEGRLERGRSQLAEAEGKSTALRAEERCGF